jgi:high-affinity nickel-transport protein
MQEDKQPLTVGLWFSLGHSTMVVLTSLVVALTASTLRGHFEPWREVAEVVATGVSAGFLFAIAAVNIVILGTVFRSFQAARRTGGPRQVSDEAFGGPRGLLARALRPLFRLMTESWHMYPLGFLFALGLETATEIALFSISGAEASRGLSNWTVLVFPVLFAAGMSLVGATNGIMMVGVYGWAFVKPIRKLYYNVAITLASVLVAMLVGSIEVLGLIAEKFELKGVFWRWVADLNQDVGTLSYTVFGIFGVSWVISALVYKIKRYDEAQGSLARDDAITGMIQARRVR